MRGDGAEGQEAPAREWRERHRRQRVRWRQAAIWGGKTRKAGERPGTLRGCQKPPFLWKSLLGGMPKLPTWENQVKKQDFSHCFHSLRGTSPSFLPKLLTLLPPTSLLPLPRRSPPCPGPHHGGKGLQHRLLNAALVGYKVLPQLVRESPSPAGAQGRAGGGRGVTAGSRCPPGVSPSEGSSC